MSYVEDDERLLLRDIERKLGEQLDGHNIYTMSSWSYKHVYLFASYILKNVAGLRLDGRKMAPLSVSDERDEEITEYDFDNAGYMYQSDNFNFKKVMEEVGSMEIMDEHTFAVSFIRTRGVYNSLVIYLTSFGMTHGVWLLVLKLMYADSSEEEEDINMVLKRVVSFFSTSNETGSGPDLCLYVALLSTVTRTPNDGWKSMESLYNLILAMQDLSAVFHFFVSDLIYGKFYIPNYVYDEYRCLLHLSAYWIAYGVAACSSQCSALPKNGYVIQDSQKLIHIRDKLTFVHRRLQKLYIDVEQFNDDEGIKNAYWIPSKHGQDSYSALVALFRHPLLKRSEGSDELKLSRCDRKDTDLSVIAMKHKILLLLIAGLDISSNKIVFLRDVYIESKTSVQQDHEVIWVPIQSGLWTTSSEEKYTKLLQMMPWYVVEHPNSISQKTKKFIQQVWKFKRRPIMVVINEKGDVVCPNGIHMMYIWRSKSFPFTPQRERTLWANEKRLDSLVFNFDPSILTMLEVGKWVILYGGKDNEWSRKFTTQVRKVLSGTDILLEMIYVGENVKLEPKSYSLNLRKVWYFWTRLESLLISKYQSFSARDNGMDPILGEVEKLLSYKSAETWACLRTPSSDSMIHGLGDVMLQAFMEFERWKQHVHTNEFAKKFQNYIEQLQGSLYDHVCSRAILHIDDKDAIKSLKCPSCNHFMEKKIQYRCCHGDETE